MMAPSYILTIVAVRILLQLRVCLRQPASQGERTERRGKSGGWQESRQIKRTQISSCQRESPRASGGTPRTEQPSVRISEEVADVTDPGVERGKRQLLLDIFVIALCAVMCGADSGSAVRAGTGIAIEGKPLRRSFD